MTVLLLRKEVRLLSLTGPPGVGKTRLSIQIALELLPNFRDGIYFVGLAPVRDTYMLLAAIAQAIGHKQPGSQDPLTDLAQALTNTNMLLVLDNFEQIAHAAPEIVSLLERAPHLKVLATSRESLSVRGEQQFVVPTLPLPDPAHSPSPHDLMSYASIALFLERAQAVKPGFELTEQNASDVASVCARLDGLPLAIELAAAYIKLLSPSAMLARLDHRLSLLTHGAHDLPVRHQTLRAAIDWSYDLLGPQERTLFARAGVFTGGCTLQALEAVCGDVSGDLRFLLDKSLMQQTDGVGGEPRFYMLETIREHAIEHLQASGEAPHLQARHANHFLHFAQEAEPKLTGPEQELWLDLVEQEHGNLRNALNWSLHHSEYAVAARIAGALLGFWNTRGYWSEGRRWLEAVLSHSEGLPAWIRAKVLLGAGRLAYFQDDNQKAQLYFDESLPLYREVDDKLGIAEVLSGQAYLAARQGARDVAAGLLEESLGVSRELGNKRNVARTLANLGRVMMEMGNHRRAAILMSEALEEFHELHDKAGQAVALESLGQLAAEQAEYTRAISLLQKSLALNRELGDKGHIAWVMGDLGIVTLAAGQYEESMSTYEEASQLFLELGDKSGWSTALFMRGVALAYLGEFETASSSFKESIQIYLEIGDVPGCALGIDGLAFVAVGGNDTRRAARLAGLAEMLRGKQGYRVELIERPMHERTLAILRTYIDGNSLEQVFSEWHSMDLEQALLQELRNLSSL